jgi:hypothetical protein
MKTDSMNHQDISRRAAMKGGIGAASLALGTGAVVPAAISTASVVATTDTAHAQAQAQGQAQAQASGGRWRVTEPATGIVMHADYARTIAQMAYVWGWPIVNMINRRAAITQAPQPGHLNGVLPAAPRATPTARSRSTRARSRRAATRNRTGSRRRTGTSRSTSAPTGARKVSSTARGSRASLLQLKIAFNLMIHYFASVQLTRPTLLGYFTPHFV